MLVHWAGVSPDTSFVVASRKLSRLLYAKASLTRGDNLRVIMQLLRPLANSTTKLRRHRRTAATAQLLSCVDEKVAWLR